jgi:N-acetylglucosaminyldiphosphoundecaprenol N-acetyl-beta-D-mannosaminyltransferase
MNNKKITLFGCNIDNLDMHETVASIEKIINEGTPRQHVVVNVAKIVTMQKDAQLKRIINSCHMVNADGMPIVWASKILGQPLSGRVTGVDLFLRLVKLCAEKGYRPFFFGAREWVVAKVVEIFQQEYSTLKIAGFRNGYFSEKEEADIASMIKESQAHILFVGFSTPMKENFLNKWMSTMGVPFCMGVGGSFDIVAGLTKRAPIWMQSYGLEWLYRLIQEPRRMWRRYATTNPMFIWMVLKEYLKGIESKQL